jgi:catechol 2,3-dioxygenase-like lactoylglutathione lyase family enzyme
MVRIDIDFNHVLIYVRDVQRAMRFYSDVLGFEVVEENGDYARLRSPKGKSTIGLHKLSGHITSRPSQKGVRLYFEVKDLDKLCKKLASGGVKIDQMPADMPWGWRHAYLRDPDGHELSLYWAGEKRLHKS